jgi:hypothetical protein
MQKGKTARTLIPNVLSVAVAKSVVGVLFYKILFLQVAHKNMQIALARSTRHRFLQEKHGWHI